MCSGSFRILREASHPLYLNQCLYGWEPDKIVTLALAHIRLGSHSDQWKVIRGATLPKPGKDDYSLAKSYRVISLLNCLGKAVEKIAAMLVSAYCEAQSTFHPS